MGLPHRALVTFPAEFRAGMASDERARMLGDTGMDAPARWEIGNPSQNNAIHVMLILNAETPAALNALRDELRAGISANQWRRDRTRRPGSRRETGQSMARSPSVFLMAWRSRKSRASKVAA